MLTLFQKHRSHRVVIPTPFFRQAHRDLEPRIARGSDVRHEIYPGRIWARTSARHERSWPRRAVAESGHYLEVLKRKIGRPAGATAPQQARAAGTSPKPTMRSGDVPQPAGRLGRHPSVIEVLLLHRQLPAADIETGMTGVCGCKPVGRPGRRRGPQGRRTRRHRPGRCRWP